MKTTLTVTLPDGTIAKRTTARPYKFVVVGRVDDTTWEAFTWHETWTAARTGATRVQTRDNIAVGIADVNEGETE
jgi:hypothetical protein